jgi:molecular chaperone DnaJ
MRCRRSCATSAGWAVSRISSAAKGDAAARAAPPAKPASARHLSLAEIAAGTQKKAHQTPRGVRHLQRARRAPVTRPPAPSAADAASARRELVLRPHDDGSDPYCGGDGKVLRELCTECRGEGVQAKEETLTVRVPAGVANGNYIPIRGMGDAGRRGGPAGDVLVMIEEQDDALFQRLGDDIITDVFVTASDAAMGTKLEVPTLNGKSALKIPAGTQSHTILRMRGKGLGRLNGGGHGDQLVRVVVHTPEPESKRERELLEELRALQESKLPTPRKGEYGFGE